MGTQHEKGPANAGPSFQFSRFEVSLELDDVARLKLAVLTRGDVEGYRSTLIQSLETVHLDLREVNEQVLAVTLRRVKPLNSTFCPFAILVPLPVSGKVNHMLHGGSTYPNLRALLHYTLYIRFSRWK